MERSGDIGVMVLGDREHAVASFIDAGHTVAELETEIERVTFLDEDERAGLWLLAWSYSELRPRRGAEPEAVPSTVPG